MERQTPILDGLYDICGRSAARLCMPGHKGDTGFFCGDALKLDITELPGADNLLAPEGVIAASQQLHADFTGAEAAYYTTGGSTAGILGMLWLFRGKKVIFPRGIHLSAANAIFAFGITPVYLNSPPSDYPPVVNADDIKAALKAHRDAAAVFIVYPNYFGLCCDIEAAAQAAHRAGIPLLVDAAHAAHFVYSPLLPLAPSYAGADIWTESAHKTLPAMNQCACLCIGKNSLVDKYEAKQALSMFQTTSPSYLLLGSLDYAHAYMRDKGEQELFRIITLGKRFEENISALPGFSCPDMAEMESADRDALKMVIDVSKTGYTGMAVKHMLANQGIYVEAADMKNILLMLSAGNTSADLETLYEALKGIESIRSSGIYFSPYSMPEATKYSQNSRGWSNIQKIKLEQSAGRISAATAGVYPPAEAVLQRGQVISYETAGYLIEAKRQGFEVFGIEGDSIRVYKERT